MYHCAQRGHETSKERVVNPTFQFYREVIILYLSIQQLGKLSSPFSMSAEVEQREQRITEYFRKRLSDLMAVSQSAESKAATLLSEVSYYNSRIQKIRMPSSQLKVNQCLRLLLNSSS